MRKHLFPAVLALFGAVLLAGCDTGNLGFYLYPQAASTGISEDRGTGPLAGLEVVGYLQANRIGTYDAAQVRHLTDLVYFTLTPKADGTLYQGVLTDSHRDFLRKVRKEYGTRILVGVTDHNRQGALSAIVGSPQLRTRFASHLTNLLSVEGFDGADFDWEYPGDEDQAGFSALLQEIHRQFSPRGLRLSVAVSPSRPLQRDAYAAVDRVHGMLYDDWGQHSTLENSSFHIREMVGQGLSPSKLLLGVPFYGRGYTSKGPAWSSAVSYKTLRERYRLSPDQDTVSGYYFNGRETIRRKVQLAKAAGLAGVMVWELGQDTTDDTSLLGAISEVRQNLSKLN